MPDGGGDVRVVDAHVHVWDPAALSYPWLEGDPLGSAHLPPEIDGASGGVDGWVFVEADASAAPEVEADWVASLEWPGLLGIVADAELDASALPARLDALRARPLVRGVRHLLQGLDDERLADPRLAEGLRRVAHEGLVFDACVRWTQLEALRRLVATAGVEGAPLVLDHLGKPPVGAGLGSQAGRDWLERMRALARVDGLAVKLSGLRAEAPSAGVLRTEAPGFLAAAIDLFGPDRCLFGTDWPVSVGGDVTSEEWIGLVREAAGDGWPAVASGTATRVYGLDPVR
ncbi:amidohydrolase family protein [Microbacterium marinilacus]|uniref:Amidohydrolase family protein n=1 Tax=Microbacterium marinilacus TaxID=415209 RepID=A0ABP7BS44_9MICO|nr:amidohydrolase family protein [Microbacterium marinilacus]MBY0689097.1 amidohydrolase family protein [Microbacterium marinilacus]